MQSCASCPNALQTRSVATLGALPRARVLRQRDGAAAFSSPKPDDPAQSKRFIELAEELGAKADPKGLEASVRRLAGWPPKPPDGRSGKGL
jgi:hypothetical protein